ncbi:hypothetical protein Tco_1352866 [Tanacetum coccineum]
MTASIRSPHLLKKEHPAKDTKFHHYHKTGHWKRNCPLYLAQLKKNKASMSGTSGIFTIELFSFPKSNSWIYDIGCGTNICNTIQGLRGYQKLNKGDLDLYVSNGNSAVVEAIGSFDLILLSEIILKHIEKLQHDGLLKLIDDESFDVCVSCISGKMARKPFTHASERANDLLGIIHSDICGPFRTTSREGANYYITFTDDFSRYGYPKEIMDYFYYPLENKILVARYAEFFKSSLISQEASGSTTDFDEIQRQDAQPSKTTIQHQPVIEQDDVDPQTDVIPVRRSARIPQAPE